MEIKKEEKLKKDNNPQNQKMHEKNKKAYSKDSKLNKDNNKDNKNNINEKKKNKKEYKIFYSAYGYIKIDKSEINKKEAVVPFIQYRPAPFKAEECIKGKISTLNYFKEINIQIKTFYNERKIYTIEKLDIFSTLQLVVQRMFEQERNEKEKNEKERNEKEKNEKINENENEKNEKKELDYEEERITELSQYRIFSCHKKIHELNPTRNLIENEIQNNELLLYLPIKKLSFSEYMKGYSVILSQEGKVASKKNTDDPQYVLGNIPYSFGKHYFEVILLTEPIAKSVIIGLATKRNPVDMFINDVQNFYGYILSDMQKISYVNGKQEKKEYSKEPIAINDIIGVLFEFKKEGLEISFFKNKICLGVAFNKIFNDKIFFPAISLGIAGSEIQISNQIDFP